MATKKSTITKDKIVSLYMNYVLEHNEKRKTVFRFSKQNAISETEFYNFFGTLESVEKEIFKMFYENTIQLIEKDKEYDSYDMRSKVLSFNFTFFELLTANRSYVLFSLKENKEGFKNLKSLKQFTSHFKDFIITIIDENENMVSDKISKVTKPVFAEGAWIQFLFLLKFWMDDTSKSFEKTDVLIEKSVNTVVDLLDTKPLESLFDLGKFLWKEKMN